MKSGLPILLCSASILLHGCGLRAPAGPPPPGDTAVTAPRADARFAPVAGNVNSARVPLAVIPEDCPLLLAYSGRLAVFDEAMSPAPGCVGYVARVLFRTWTRDGKTVSADSVTFQNVRDQEGNAPRGGFGTWQSGVIGGVGEVGIDVSLWAYEGGTLKGSQSATPGAAYPLRSLSFELVLAGQSYAFENIPIP